MARLFIANCTKTNQELHFVVREHLRTMMIPIKIGHQVQVWKDAPIEDLQYIVDQLLKYGLADSREAYKNKSFVGLCFSFDKPVDADLLEAMIEKNYNLLDDRAQQERINSALVLNQSIKNEMQQNGMPGGLRELTVNVTEEPKVGAIGKGNINEQIRISPNIQEGVRKSKSVTA